MYFLELLISGNRKYPTTWQTWLNHTCLGDSLKLCKVQKRVRGVAHTIVAKPEKLKTLSACEPLLI